MEKNEKRLLIRKIDIEDKIDSIVDDIVSDITDRRGLGQEWRSIDEDIQEEIKKQWATIIKKYI